MAADFDWSNATYEDGTPVVLSSSHNFPYAEKYVVLEYKKDLYRTYHLKTGEGYAPYYPKVIEGYPIIEEWRL